MYSELTAFLEEVDGLDARIAATPDLPFAHLAPRYIALARHELESKMAESEANDGVVALRHKVKKSCESVDSLGLLRKIVDTTAIISVVDAIHANDISFVSLLIDSGAEITRQAFPIACEKGQTEIVRLLIDLPIERGVNPGANDNAALQRACEKGQTEIVRLLLDLPVERGVNPGANDNAALQRACEKGQTEIVRLLLDFPVERGVNPGAKNNNALGLACNKGHIDIVRLLIDLPVERGVNPGCMRNGPCRYCPSATRFASGTRCKSWCMR
jgi:hypothetical protein